MNVYGTRIKSDVPFPLDLPVGTGVREEVELSSQIPPGLKNSITYGFPFYLAHGRKVYLFSDREFDGSEVGQPWCYEVKDVVRFYWVGGERSVYYELGGDGNANLLSFWFIHLLLPLYFTLEDRYDFLHAGAVEVEGKPILFIAPSMGGKSTMTNHFVQQGHPLVSDDKVATFLKEGDFFTVGSHPYHRPYRKFEELGHRAERFTEDFKPIYAFYKLEETTADGDISIKEISGFQKFNTLMPNYLFMFSYLRPQRLKYLGSMLNKIRMFQVQVPWDMNRLGEVHSAICEHSSEFI